MGSSNGKAVLVTGASKGIGLEIALTLAERGFRVWAGVRDPEAAELKTAEAARGIKLHVLPLEVTDDESVAAAMRRIESVEGNLYGLVNNAGITARCCFEDFPEENIRQIFEVNTFGAMRVTRHALPLLRRRGEGRVVLVSSIGGRIGSISVAPYVASKFALEGFAESLSLELKFFNIDVSIIEPGMVKTSIWGSKRILPEAFDEKSAYHSLFWSAEELAESVLGSSTLQPSDVAAVAVRAMTTAKPQLRYVVGRRASLVLKLRRYLPGELFERLYFGGQVWKIRKRMNSPAPPAQGSRIASSGKD